MKQSAISLYNVASDEQLTKKMTPISNPIAAQTLHWVQSFIIQYNLCPFAKAAVNKNQLKIEVSESHKNAQALEELMTEVFFLDQHPEIETTLLVFAHGLKDFFAYLDFIDLAERLLREQGYEGIYQVATFHPNYFFADSDPDDASNYTNRSPYPMIHLLREESLDKVITAYGDTSKIPERNINIMQELGKATLNKIQNACFDEKNQGKEG